MTTDITELALREKFEAWWERTQHNGNPPRFGWERWREGEGYKVDDDDSELDGMWAAWKAASAELVEALEKAQNWERQWKEAAERRGKRLTRQALEILKQEQRIAELESFRTAYMEWSDKTDWVQTDKRFGVVKPLGKHRADVLKEYIQHLESRTVKLPEVYGYLREKDGQIQISIGAERPSDRSGGYATPWFAIYTAAGIKAIEGDQKNG